MSSLDERYDLWIDPNEIQGWETHSLKKFSKNPAGVRKGERLRVGDHDGFRAMAEVVEDDHSGVVRLRIDLWTVYFV